MASARDATPKIGDVVSISVTVTEASPTGACWRGVLNDDESDIWFDRSDFTSPAQESYSPTVPAVEGEAQNGLNDIALGDPYPVAAILKGIRQRSIQALHAGLSRRDWHATEVAANEARDAIDRLLIRMGERS